MRTMISLLLGAAVALCAAAPPPAGKATPTKFTAEQVRFYEQEVQPILKSNCLRCHGAKRANGKLRLDSRLGLLTGGELGPAVRFDRPEDSPLLKAVNHRDKLEMPPPPKGKLSKQHIATLTRWVQMGAPYATGNDAVPAPVEHAGMKVTDADRAYWAYRPLARPAVPAVKNAGWLRSPIDAFILAKLEAKGLTPAGEADRVTLARRLYYDLTGLPPTPVEVDAFVRDTRPGGYERLVDQLLASPGYGEKWGRHWLDLVRFAETHGYERDSAKPFAWRFRDYVVASLNADKPYSRFLLEQLAGDELDEVTAETLTATGYYRLGLWDDEPVDRLQARYDVLDGVVSTTAQVVLGMTVGCARCHDHKKDPIPQKDYYRLLAFFNDVTDMNVRNTRRLLDAEERKKEDAEQKAAREREAKLYQELYALEQKFVHGMAKKGLAAGDVIGRDLVELKYRFYRDTWESLPDFDALKAEETGEVNNGYFSLRPASRQEAIGLVFEGKLRVPSKGEYTFELFSQDGARLLVDGKRVLDRPGKGEQKQKATVTLPSGLVKVRLEYFHTYGRPLLDVSWSGPGVPKRALSEGPTAVDGKSVRGLIRKHGDELLGEKDAARYFRLTTQLAQARKRPPSGRGIEVMCVEERGRATTRLLVRGNPHAPGEALTPGVPEVLRQGEVKLAKYTPRASSGNRRALADWLTDAKAQPATARVMANRLWQFHFGRGIVPTPSDFGKLGDAPTHPELLDFLAGELVRNGWELKAMHRAILMSAAYRMSSRGNAAGLAKDPANNLFWRFNMRRLSAEEVRDSMLSASGTLSRRMAGPGVYPTIPPEVLAGQSRPGAGWGKSPPAEQARRSVYVHVKRSLIVPILEVHDLADTDSSCAVRHTTTVPTQSLGMLNGAFTNEQAAAVARRVEREGKDVTERVRRVIRLTTGRVPGADEVRRDVAFVGELKDENELSDARALELYCLMALNANEFVYLD